MVVFTLQSQKDHIILVMADFCVPHEIDKMPQTMAKMIWSFFNIISVKHQFTSNQLVLSKGRAYLQTVLTEVSSAEIGPFILRDQTFHHFSKPQ